jgi:Arc/MetJ-type ribon-helix-helix transcriptional regulator
VVLLAQVQLRLSQKLLEEIDRWVAEGRFKSRSDAIRAIVSFYEEREKTREFFKMLIKRSEEAKKHLNLSSQSRNYSDFCGIVAKKKTTWSV